MEKFKNFIEYKVAIKSLLISVFVFIFFYILYSQNQQICSLNNSLLILAQDNQKLNEMLLTNLKELDLIKKQLDLEKIDFVKNNNSFLDNNNFVKNDMTKFYIKTLGICVVSLLVVGTVYYSFGFLSFKYLIPSSIISLIQDYTPLLNETKLFTYTDNINNIVWLIKIINNKKIDLSAKFLNSSDDFENASNFIEKLLRNSTLQNLNTLNNLTTTDLVVPSTIDLINSSALVTELVTNFL